jgi:hypothetical protein
MPESSTRLPLAIGHSLNPNTAEPSGGNREDLGECAR